MLMYLFKRHPLAYVFKRLTQKAKASFHCLQIANTNKSSFFVFSNLNAKRPMGKVNIINYP